MAPEASTHTPHRHSGGNGVDENGAHEQKSAEPRTTESRRAAATSGDARSAGSKSGGNSHRPRKHDADQAADPRAADLAGSDSPAPVTRIADALGDDADAVDLASVPLEQVTDRFADRELGWLAFNERVLELAEDGDLPLLERVRFLSIFSSNLDEFFMVRVAGLKRRITANVAVRTSSGLLPTEVLQGIWNGVRTLSERQVACFASLLPDLAEHGIQIVHWSSITATQRKRLSTMFSDTIFPVLTPLAVDPAHPFPYISGLSLNLAVIVRNPVTGLEHFARVKVPPSLPRFVRTEGEEFVPLEDLIEAHLDQLFPGMEIRQAHMFRVTRNEDLEVEEDDAENILAAIEKELLRRRFGPPVRLEIEDTVDAHVLELIVSELGVSEEEVFILPGPLDLTSLMSIANLRHQDLQYPVFVPTTAASLAEVETANPADLFAALRRHDVLLHHPYDAFATTVQRFVEQAAADPQVLAIKQTLYRTSGDSPIVDALIDAAEAGKQVLALVEIKARFDEQANISWARKLEQSGVHVVYGLVGLKTHCKLCLVVREEGDGIRRYCHIGTGNYNPKTARLYEDLGLLTADPAIGQDLTQLFNNLSGYSRQTAYSRLLVAPHSVRSGLVDRVHAEIDHHRAGRPARIRFKLNSLVDEDCIDALYEASRAGVAVDILTRGICALRPGVRGLSDNIRVRSILGRFLEHSRIYSFAAGGDGEYWIGSADLMHRNLDRRVEALVRLDDESHKRELGKLLDLEFDAGTSSWHLGPDAAWTRHSKDRDGRPLVDAQSRLMATRPRPRTALIDGAASVVDRSFRVLGPRT